MEAPADSTIPPSAISDVIFPPPGHCRYEVDNQLYIPGEGTDHQLEPGACATLCSMWIRSVLRHSGGLERLDAIGSREHVLAQQHFYETAQTAAGGPDVERFVLMPSGLQCTEFDEFPLTRDDLSQFLRTVLMDGGAYFARMLSKVQGHAIALYVGAEGLFLFESLHGLYELTPDQWLTELPDWMLYRYGPTIDDIHWYKCEPN